MNNCKLGHTSPSESAPESSSTRFAITSIQLGIPAKIRTSSFRVACAIASTFSSQLSMRAMRRSGVLLASTQNGKFRTMMALKSPEYEPVFSGSREDEPPRMRCLPSYNFASGRWSQNNASKSLPPFVMTRFQRRFRYRQKLAPIGTCTGTFCKPLCDSRP